MAHQPRDDGGTWSCGVGASTWMPCAKHVHGRLSRILTRRGVEVEEKCRKIGEKSEKEMQFSLEPPVRNWKF